jgi:hypothetical protein
MLFGFYPPVPAGGTANVWAFKAYGIENAGFVTVGPTVSWGTQSHSKTNLMNQLFGDFSTVPMYYGLIVDPEFVDHPISDPGT